MSRTGTCDFKNVYCDRSSSYTVNFWETMRFEVLTAVNTETTLFQPARQVLAIQDTMTANSVHKFTTQVLNNQVTISSRYKLNPPLLMLWGWKEKTMNGIGNMDCHLCSCYLFEATCIQHEQEIRLTPPGISDSGQQDAIILWWWSWTWYKLHFTWVCVLILLPHLDVSCVCVNLNELLTHSVKLWAILGLHCRRISTDVMS